MRHSRVSGNPEPRHVRPSLDARFRGRDTDVSELSPHFQRLTRLDDRFGETGHMIELGDSPFSFLMNRICAIGGFWKQKVSVSARRVDRKTKGKKVRNKTGRNPLKSHETAKSDISHPNDFNGFRGVLRNQNASQAKFSLRLRSISPVFVSLRNVQAGWVDMSRSSALES